MRRCYFSKNYAGLKHGGNKARVDMEEIMEELGYINVGVKRTYYTNKIWGFILTFCGVLKAIFCLKKGDYLVLQYPLKKYYSFLCKVTHLKGGKVITLIHDLGAFRRKKLTSLKEKKRLSNTDYIIALNDSMRDYLISQDYNIPIGVLGIWDYLSKSEPIKNKKDFLSNNIMYVGTLDHKKHSFMYAFDKSIKDDANYKIVIYGSGFNAEEVVHKNVLIYRGYENSDNIIINSDSKYGLLWYGNSIYECEGPFGEYIKINTAHKASLYIRCNIPIIVWEQAAIAKFIKENNIGICINSLEELENVLQSITEEHYLQMRANVIEIDKKVKTGFYFKKALATAEECLLKN